MQKKVKSYITIHKRDKTLHAQHHDTVSNWQMNTVQHIAAGKKRKKKLNIWCV